MNPTVVCINMPYIYPVTTVTNSLLELVRMQKLVKSINYGGSQNNSYCGTNIQN